MNLVPLCFVVLLTWLAIFGRVIPIAVSLDCCAARSAVRVIPLRRFPVSASLADARRVGPILTNPHFIAATFTGGAIPVRHINLFGETRLAWLERGRRQSGAVLLRVADDSTAPASTDATHARAELLEQILSRSWGLASCYVLEALIKAPAALSARRWDGAMMDMIRFPNILIFLCRSAFEGYVPPAVS